MAELSLETQAIINRLKAEGDLNRNSGTHSIRSVKIELQKFGNVFTAISNNILEQTNMMRTQLGLAETAQERLKTNEQFEELKTPLANQTDDDKGKDVKPLSEVGEKKGDAIAKLLTLKNLAMIGAGGFVATNLIKGYIDEKGGLKEALIDAGVPETAFEDMAKFGESMQEIAADTKLLAEDLGKITAFFGDVITKVSEFADNPLSIFGLGLGAGALFSAGKAMAGGGDGGAGNKMKGLKMKMAGGVVGLALMFGDEAAKWLADQTLPEGWETKPYGSFLKASGSVAKGALTGAYIGSFFGPGGALIGAIVGGSLSLGVQMYDWYNQRKAENEAQLAADLAEADRILLTRKEEFVQQATDLSSMTPEQQADATEGMTTPEVLALNKTITPLQLMMEELAYLRNEKSNFELMGQTMQASALETQISEMQAEINDMDVSVASLEAIRTGLRDRYNSMLGSDGERLPETSLQDYSATYENLLMMNEIMRNRGGSSSLGIEVVPGGSTYHPGMGYKWEGDLGFNPQSNAGQKARDADKISADQGGNVIIGGNTTIAPSPTYITNGGHQVSQVSFSGGGGMGAKTLLPYGITSGLIA